MDERKGRISSRREEQAGQKGRLTAGEAEGKAAKDPAREAVIIEGHAESA